MDFRPRLVAIAAGFSAALPAAAQQAAPIAPTGMEQVRELLGQGRSDEAIAVLRNIVGREPDNAAAHNALGSLLNGSGRYQEALAHAERASALAPDNMRYRYNRGVVRAEHGRFADAVADFDAALKAQPDLTYGWLERGAARLALGDGRGASEDWQRARSADPKLVWVDWYVATGDFLAGRFASAADGFARVATAESGFGPAAVWRYVADRRAGRTPPQPPVAEGEWPRPALDYFAGRIDSDRLLAIASEDKASGDARRIGEAHFFIAQQAHFDGRADVAVAHLREAAAVAAPRHLWKQAAERDLARLNR